MKKYEDFIRKLDELFYAGEEGVLKGIKLVDKECLTLGIRTLSNSGKRMSLSDQLEAIKNYYQLTQLKKENVCGTN